MKEEPIKVKILKNYSGMYRGYLYANGKEIEKTPEYMSKRNCITYLNQRIDYHNAKHNLNIPYYDKEQHNENA